MQMHMSGTSVSCSVLAWWELLTDRCFFFFCTARFRTCVFRFQITADEELSKPGTLENGLVNNLRPGHTPRAPNDVVGNP